MSIATVRRATCRTPSSEAAAPPLRLGAQGHPAGPARRARRGARPRDLGAGQARARDDPPQRQRRRLASGTSSARTPASPSTTAGSARASRCIRPGSTRRCATAPRARRSSTRCARTPCTRSRARTPGRTSATGCRSSTGSSSPTGTGSTSSACPRARARENMSFLKMCVPADGVNGIKRFVLESIVGAGGKPCPPGIVGVGIGGSADYAMYLAKEAIMRPIGTRNPDPLVAAARGRALRRSSTRRASARWGSAATSPSCSATSSTPTPT